VKEPSNISCVLVLSKELCPGDGEFCGESEFEEEEVVVKEELVKEPLLDRLMGENDLFGIS
jgi:hypothetical protein